MRIVIELPDLPKDDRATVRKVAAPVVQAMAESYLEEIKNAKGGLGLVFALTSANHFWLTRLVRVATVTVEDDS